MELKYTVLIIEDEKNIAGFMSEALKANGFNALTAVNGADGLMCAASHCPDIIILELGLSDMDGIDVIRSLRQWSVAPIIVVSGRTLEKDKIEALDEGADDYLTKPFGMGELMARIRTALRHSNKGNGVMDEYNGKYIARDLVIDFEKRRIQLKGIDIHLTQIEYKIVTNLAMVSGKVVTYDSLMKKIWGPNMISDNKILRVNMANIRRKIEDNPAEPQYIHTEVGIGYRMIENTANDCI